MKLSMKQKETIFTILILLAVGIPHNFAFAAAEPGTASLTIKVSGFQNDSGSAAIFLWQQPGHGFPIKMGEAVRAVKSQIRDKAVLHVFENLVPGNFAVSVYHDKNGNGKLDRNLIGMPVEPRGASMNPRPVMRPPRFAEADFDLGAGDNRTEISLVD